MVTGQSQNITHTLSLSSLSLEETYKIVITLLIRPFFFPFAIAFLAKQSISKLHYGFLTKRRKIGNDEQLHLELKNVRASGKRCSALTWRLKNN